MKFYNLNTTDIDELARNVDVCLAFDLLDDMEEDREAYLIGDLWYDSDKIIVDGKCSQCIIKKEDNLVILDYNDMTEGETERAKEMFSQWINDGERDKHYSNLQSPTWDDFYKLDNGIAYRGGIGYTYAIYEYKGEGE